MESEKLIINNKIDQLDRVRKYLEQIGTAWDLDNDMVFQLNLVLEEYISNLICYGYSDDAFHEISVEISKESDRLLIVVTDDSNSFNILELPANNEINKPLEERRIGGLGVHFIKTLTDHLEYKRDGGKNRILMMKKIH